MRHIFLIILFCLCTALSIAQDAGSQLLFETFEQRFVQLDSLIFTSSHNQNGYDSLIYAKTRIKSEGNATIDSLIQQQAIAQTTAFKHQTGLSITGQTYYRLDDGLAIDEDDAVSRYKAKVQLELRWHIFNSALLHRQNQIQSIETKGNIERIKLNKADMQQQITSFDEYFQLKYDSLLAGILQQRLHNLTLMNEAQIYLLEHGNISSDDMLNIINEKAEAERSLAAIGNNYPIANDLSTPMGIIVDIDTAGMIEYINAHHYDLELMQLQLDLLTQEIQRNTYWTSLNISPFIRYSHYFRTNLPNSTNVDFGLSFIIPLSAEKNKQKTAMKAEQLVMEQQRLLVQQKIANNIRIILGDIDRLNQSSLGEINRMKDLKKYLQLRSNAYNNRIGEYNIILRTKEYNVYLQCWEKFLQYQYQRDALLMTLQAYLPNISVYEFCIGTIIR